jgi:hypothetical protein
MNFMDFMSAGGSGIIGGGLGLLGDAIGMGVQAAENEKNRQWAEKMRDYENEYNSPKQQIARLKEAGLNPALIYQQGAGSMTSASAPSPSNAGRPLGKIDFGSAFQAYQDAQIHDQQLKLMEKEIQARQIANDLANEDLISKQRENRKGAFMEENNAWATELGLNNMQLTKLATEVSNYEANIRLINQKYDQNIDRHQWERDKNYREQKYLEIAEAGDARAQENHRYIQEVREMARVNDIPAESLMQKINAGLAGLSYEEKARLLKAGFDPDNPPKDLLEYERFADALLKKSQVKNTDWRTVNEVLNSVNGVSSALKNLPIVGPMFDPLGTSLKVVNSLPVSFFRVGK